MRAPIFALFVAVVVLIVVAASNPWIGSRFVRHKSPLLLDDLPARKSLSSARLLLVLAGCCLAFGICFASGLFVAILLGENDAYHRRYFVEKNIIDPILAADPAFARVEALEKSDGGVGLAGAVRDARDQARLRRAVVQAFGEPRAEELMRAVGVIP
jgi:hypothetical protein